jgi:RimJ/RimL family protein N-acetyltransferase
MPEIPTLETKRLMLRPHKLEDFTACAAMWAEPVVTRYIGGKPSSEQQTWARMTSYLGHWALMGFGYWAVQEKETGSYIGELGFADFKRELEPSIAGIPELGWALASAKHGKGYATEALRAALSWGDARFGRSRTVCIINPENAASIRVAQKCGYRELQKALHKGEPTILFSREPGS